MVYRNECPICGSSKRDFVTDKGDGFTEEKVWLCLNCSVVYLDPYQDDVNNFYRSNQFSEEYRGGGPTMEKVAKNYIRALNRWSMLKDELHGATSLLEIGCSSGEFLDLASNTIIDVRGVELSTSYAEFAINKGHGVAIVSFPEEYVDNLWVDAIVSFHTLEHVVNPADFINAVYNILPDKGYFAIEYPNLLLALKTRGPRFNPRTYFQKAHLVDFNHKILRSVMKRRGFTFVKSWVYDNYPEDKNTLDLFRKLEDSEPESTDMNGAVLEIQDRLGRVV